MTEEEIVHRIYEHMSGLFPKTCGACGRSYATPRDYILMTTPLGPAISYDVDLGDWHPTDPFGIVALANCPCGSTMALTTTGEPLPMAHETLDWIRVQTEKRGVSVQQLLDDLRDKVRQRAMAEPIDSLRYE